MKKYLFTFLVSVTVFIRVTPVYAGDYLLGYSKTQTSKNVGEGNDQVIHKLSVALELDKTNRAIINDGRIAGVAFALSRGTAMQPVQTYTNLSVWVRRTLDGGNIAEKKIDDQDIVLPGWNYFTFDTPLSIENEDKLYVGYTITANGLIISCDGAKNPDKRSCWIGVDDKAWINHTAGGHLAIRAAFTGDNVPQADADFTNIASPAMVKTGEGEFGVTAYIYNKASKITSADLVCKLNGKELSRASATDLEIPFASMGMVFFNGFTCSEAGDLDVQFELTNINGTTDVDMSENTIGTSLLSTPDCVPRKVLLEHFTTLECRNCPEGLAVLTEGVKGFEDRIAWVAHHVGYGTDDYTLDESNNFLYFFNGGTYAPAAMIDRVNWSKMGAITASQGGYVAATGPAFAPTNGNFINLLLANRLSEYSPVKISIEQEYSEWPNLNITVKTQCLQELRNPNLSLFLIEDGLPGSPTHGVQNHVLRYIGNAAPYVGDAIKLDANGINETKFAVSIKESWSVSNMKIVAMVGNFVMESFDVNNAEILNTEIVEVLNHPQSIEADHKGNNMEVFEEDGRVVVKGNYTSMQVYTVDGKAVANNNLSGVYLVKVMNDEVIHTYKVFVK